MSEVKISHKVTFKNRQNITLELGETNQLSTSLRRPAMFCPSLTGMGVHNLRGKDDLGSVRQPKGTAIIKRQFQAGYVLLCVARPKEGCIFEVGVESHSTLYQNPFSTPLRSLYLKRPKQR